MNRATVTLAALALLLVSVGPAKADIVYTQPSDFPGGTGFASQNDTGGGNGNFATVYDNFTLTTTAGVNHVDWQGIYFNPPSQGDITGFTLTFWANTTGSIGNQPGAALLTEHIAGNAGETFVGNTVNTDGVFPTYNYGADLPSVFTATAGTEYWLSIVPDVAFPPQWGWHSGVGGDNRAIQDFQGSRNVLASDMAFTLSAPSTAVPEPCTLALLGTAAATGLGYFGWRRRKQPVAT